MPFVPGVVQPANISGSCRWFIVCESSLIVHVDGGCTRLPSADEIEALKLDTSDAYYLGQLDGDDCFTIAFEGHELKAPLSAQGLRGLFGRLDDEIFAVAGRAVQIANFGVTHRYCGCCGSSTIRHPQERCVQCGKCGHTCYPRIAPAIIVLVRRGDDALLAHSSRFPSAFYSTLAGFVEPGETLEQTLEREVLEEVGLSVTKVRYFGSQPWPFPHSLMVGFFAEYAGGEITVDGVEIADARWFSVDKLPPIPPKLSIARKLIDTWIEDVTCHSSGLNVGE